VKEKGRKGIEKMCALSPFLEIEGVVFSIEKKVREIR
jgi:hypothetical protein